MLASVIRRRVAHIVAALSGVSATATLATLAASSTSAASASSSPPVALSKDEFRPFTVQSVDRVTHNTVRLRVALPSNEHILGLHVASCLVIRGPVGPNNEMVVRPYTPTSESDARGFFELVIKEYPDGKLTPYLAHLKPGDTLEAKGPFPKIQYTPNMKKKIGMVAGGSGITPMIQVIQEIVRNPDDRTEVTLLFANQSEADVILKDYLDGLAKKHSRLNVVYIIDRAKNPAEWKGHVGYINDELLKKYMPAPSDDNMVFVCGPPGMMKALSGEKKSPADQGVLDGALKRLGYNESQVYKF